MRCDAFRGRTDFIIHTIWGEIIFKSVPISLLRPMSAEETVSYWLEMFDTEDVAAWPQYLDHIDLPRLQMSFAGIFGHILLLEFGYNDTITIATPIMGREALISRSQEN